MQAVLLILILFGDPSGEQLSKDLAADLGRLAGANAKILIGTEAAKELEKHDVRVADLMSGPNIGAHLTTSTPNLIIIHLERSESAGDIVVNSSVWLEGRSDKHVAIGGNGADPEQGVLKGLLPIIQHRFPEQPGAGVIAPASDEAQLAAQADRKEWQTMLGNLAGVEKKSPRQFYYQILAYSRLVQRDAAVESLNQMREKYPDHFLIKAAEEMIPPLPHDEDGKSDDGNANSQSVEPKQETVPPEDDGGNVLK